MTITLTGAGLGIPTVSAPAPSLPWVTDGLVAAYDASYASSRFQERAGTTAALADDPIGQLADLSGNGKHLLAPNDTTGRGTFKSVGGVDYVELTTGNNWLEIGEALVPFSNSALTVMALVNGATDGYFFTMGNSSDNNPIYAPFATNSGSSTSSAFWIRDDANVSILNNTQSCCPAAFNGSWNAVTQSDDGADTIGYNNNFSSGAPFTTRSYDRTGHTLTLDKTVVGALARGSPASPMQVNFSILLVYDKVLSDAERATNVAYMETKDGS